MITTFERGFFTLEDNIQGLNLSQIEDKLGFEKRRLFYGVDFLIFKTPPSTDYFESYGTTLTAEHTFPKNIITDRRKGQASDNTAQQKTADQTQIDENPII